MMTEQMSSYRAQVKGFCYGAGSGRLVMRVMVLAVALLSLVPREGSPAESGVRILLFAGQGGPHWLTVRGRVLRGEPARAPDPARGSLANAAETVRAFASREIAGARVRVSLGSWSSEVKTDADGVFEARATGVEPALPAGASTVHAELVSLPADPAPLAVSADGPLFVVADGPGVAVVSDFDDTVVQTGVTHKAQMLAQVLAANAAQLEPTPGIVALYRSAREAGCRAFFYVSGSPHNLYERIVAYLAYQGLPSGPVLLKNFPEDPVFAQTGYKEKRIEALFAAYPELRFVLMGDSGESDPAIYAGLARRFPDRVAGIVIRELPEKPVAQPVAGMHVTRDFSTAPDLVAKLVSARP
jgi:phosphatidate phosphatase APP1